MSCDSQIQRATYTKKIKLKRNQIRKQLKEMCIRDRNTTDCSLVLKYRPKVLKLSKAKVTKDLSILKLIMASLVWSRLIVNRFIITSVVAVKCVII